MLTCPIAFNGGTHSLSENAQTKSNRCEQSVATAYIFIQPNDCLKGFSTRYFEPNKTAESTLHALILRKNYSNYLRLGSDLRVLKHKFQSDGLKYMPLWSGHCLMGLTGTCAVETIHSC